MSTWSTADAGSIGDATELDLASRRSDGTLRSTTTMWVVAVDDDIYVRSAGGPDRPWYQRALAGGSGHIRAGDIDADVVFEDAGTNAPHERIDAAYHAKYDRYGPAPVGHVTGPGAHPTTIRLHRSAP